MALIPGLKKVTVKTRFTPTIDFDTEQEGPPSETDRLIRPHVTATIGSRAIVLYSPYGEPTSLFPWIVAGAGGLALVVLALTIRLLR